MTRKSRTFERRLVAAGLVLSVAAWWKRLDAVPRPAQEPPAPAPADSLACPTANTPAPDRRPRARRFATSFAFAVIFFAGAVFTAGAGNIVAHTDEPTSGAVDIAAPADPGAAVTSDPSSSPVVDALAPATGQAAPAEVGTSPDPAAGTDPGAATDPAPDPAADLEASKAPVRTGYTPPSQGPASVAGAPPAMHPRVAKRRVPVRVTEGRPAPVRPVVVPFVPAIPFDLTAWENANPASSLGATAVAIARHFVGTPYVWGGASPSGGFDCSGLMQYVYGQLGISLPHYAAAQFAIFPRLSSAQLRPGDLVFFEPKIDGPGHVAMYVGGDAILEAPHTGALVRLGSLSRSAASLGFIGAVRPYSSDVSALRLTAIHRSARTASGPGTTDLVFAV